MPGITGRGRRQNSGSRAVTVTELLVVLAILAVLTTVAVTEYVTARKAADISDEARKIRGLLACARSLAISSGGDCYQATFWDDQLTSTSWYWIDRIAPSDPMDFITPTSTTLRQVVTPEVVHNHVEITNSIGGVTDPILNTVSFRFYPDGTSDDGSIYLIRKEADHNGSFYYKVKLYGPTARAAVFENQPKP